MISHWKGEGGNHWDGHRDSQLPGLELRAGLHVQGITANKDWTMLTALNNEQLSYHCAAVGAIPRDDKELAGSMKSSSVRWGEPRGAEQ